MRKDVNLVLDPMTFDLSDALRDELAKRIIYVRDVLSGYPDLALRNLEQFRYLNNLLVETFYTAINERNHRLGKYRNEQSCQNSDFIWNSNLREESFIKSVKDAIFDLNPDKLFEKLKTLISEYPEYFSVTIADEWKIDIIDKIRGSSLST